MCDPSDFESTTQAFTEFPLGRLRRSAYVTYAETLRTPLETQSEVTITTFFAKVK